MKSRKLVFVALCFCIITANLTATAARQTSYPTKAISMIVPYDAGGTTDLTGRQFAILLRKYLGQSVNVVNQAGASGAIGCRTVLDAAPDGYTILYTAESLGTQRVMGISEMSYDDFIPIMTVVNDPKVIVAKTGRYNTLNDLVADMRARPGRVRMSYTGPGGSGHVQALVYNKFGLDMALTAYSGGGPAIVAVLGEQVDFTNSNYSTVPTYVESGDLVLLGISATSRLPTYPNVPTLVEIIPESAQYLETPFTPLSLLVNKNTPPEIVQILREAAQKVVQDPEWKTYVRENNLEELYLKYPDEASIRKFYADWESSVSWLLYDAGAAQYSPERFNIPRLR
jgi:tripartite-type tricarboxylate transporter receptor subunit TctC